MQEKAVSCLSFSTKPRARITSLHNFSFSSDVVIWKLGKVTPKYLRILNFIVWHPEQRCKRLTSCFLEFHFVEQMDFKTPWSLGMASFDNRV